MDLKTSVKKGLLFRRISIIAKNDYWLPHISPSASVCLFSHRAPFPLGEFPRNFMFEGYLKASQKFQFSLKSDENNGHFT
jgi:hypothetical protein